MIHSVIVPTFQVETKKGNNIYYDLEQANREYEKHCEKNIPTELYRDGIKVKEYKPLF